MVKMHVNLLEPVVSIVVAVFVASAAFLTALTVLTALIVSTVLDVIIVLTALDVITVSAVMEGKRLFKKFNFLMEKVSLHDFSQGLFFF